MKKYRPVLTAIASTLIALAVADRPVVSQASPPAEPPAKPDGHVVSAGKSKLTFYGFLRLDAVYDSDRPNNAQIPGFILSPDLNPPQGPSAGRSDLTFHPRLSRLGIDFEGPPVAGLGSAKLSGKLEMDFYNLPASPTSLNSNSREFLRLRHVWAKLDWDRVSVLAGQREDLIAPLTPTVNNDLVLWGAGNLGDRRPQLRVEVKAKRLTLGGMAGVTGAVDNQNLEGTNNQFFDGEVSSVPTLQGRVGWTFDGPAKGKKSTVGVWGHWAKEELEVGRTFANGRTEFSSRAVGTDFSIVLAPSLWVKGEAWVGRNLDDVRGGIFQGVIAGEEIESKGGWLELGFPRGKWTPVIGASMDDPDDEFLPRKSATTNPGPAKNFVWYASCRWRSGALELGADFLRWRTEFAGRGIAPGVDHRINLMTAYHF